MHFNPLSDDTTLQEFAANARQRKKAPFQKRMCTQRSLTPKLHPPAKKKAKRRESTVLFAAWSSLHRHRFRLPIIRMTASLTKHVTFVIFPGSITHIGYRAFQALDGYVYTPLAKAPDAWDGQWIAYSDKVVWNFV